MELGKGAAWLSRPKVRGHPACRFHDQPCLLHVLIVSSTRRLLDKVPVLSSTPVGCASAAQAPATTQLKSQPGPCRLVH